MLDYIKKNYINLCIVLIYTVVACLVYGIWSYTAWQLWYVTFIIVLIITIAGAVIGYLWLKPTPQAKEEIDTNKNA